jgi:hypothetical protein
MSFCDRQGIPEVLLRGLDATGRQGSQDAQIDSIVEGKGEGDSEANDSENNWKNDDSTDPQSNKSEIDTFEDDILVLRNYSFIIANKDRSTFKIHRLVQLATLE